MTTIEVSQNVHFTAEPARKTAYQWAAQGGAVECHDKLHGWRRMYGSILDVWGPDYIVLDNRVTRACAVDAYRLS